MQARDLVLALRWPESTSVRVLSAYHLPTAWFAEGGLVAADLLAEAEEVMRRQAEEELASMAAPLEGHGWAIERRVIRGRAADAILTTADEMDADVIVLGSRGHGQIGSMLLGSVSAEVADRARRSVLVARTGSVSRLLVATDGSACSHIIPEVIGGWDTFKGLPAVALSVAAVDSPPLTLLVTLYTTANQPLEAQRERLRELHRGYAESMAGRLTETGIAARAELRNGDAAREITTAAAEIGADLIVTGSRCLQGLERWLLGSVARNVLLHAQASVLIVRDEEAAGS
jgi:nucleotide-binding universal stress UspA family protein